MTSKISPDREPRRVRLAPCLSAWVTSSLTIFGCGPSGGLGTTSFFDAGSDGPDGGALVDPSSPYEGSVARVDSGVVVVPPFPPVPPPPPLVDVRVAGRAIDLGMYLLAGISDAAHLSDTGTAAALLGVADVSLTTLGLKPEKTARSSAELSKIGRFEFTLPQNGKVILFGSKQGAFASYSEIVTSAGDTDDAKLLVASRAYIASLATAYNVDLELPFQCTGLATSALRCVFGIIVGRIVDRGSPAGVGQAVPRQPVSGIGAADFTITSGASRQPWPSKGPYFLNHDGTAAPEAQASIAIGDPATGILRGGLFVVFVEIPQTEGPAGIDLRISIAHTAPGSPRYFDPVQVRGFRPYGVSWSVMTETGLAPSPVPGPTPDGMSLDFASRIYPVFFPIAQGGFGCQGCHTDQGGVTPAGGMNLVGIETAYASLDPARNPLRVNVANPSLSLVLKRPLFEPVGEQDHPIYAFTSERDDAYRLLLAWISAGAPR